MELKDKVALVTGGGRGIGRETCILLAKQGAKVAVFSDNESESKETASYISEVVGSKAIAFTGDVRSEEDINHAVQTTQESLGSIDILINNAGVMLLKPFHEMTVKEWDFVQDVNIRGVYLCTRAVVPQMMEKRHGVIINLSSIWGTKGGPDRSAYIASKYACLGFSKALGEELKPYKIRVNAVCPGPVNTKMMDDFDVNKDNWLHPRDLANVIVDLCLPKSVAVTATAIEAFGYGRPVNL
ncbi:SDR family oxidoreductase [Bacillus sp. ISL-40]|uniref:SDR family NAD(P)-dependent oxidoreductase n=1 Tax=unclassified Bacillus (in: firmicutes) TaxID=185979 RepID=UPI001BE601C5|nr:MULTISPECIES: SDR family oxidoreductase [unclassified Bacillus (in: firmicutes)]MBT2700099.1 SDR family oxidoreductase [Bacillus sp. ISL-40]MBT2720582.1 SDR family oxidoreductase [Bacillus sp. ISL-46]MBT2741245.1 SDR family oxidoreductase [Bacillus sp. ISL-77]